MFAVYTCPVKYACVVQKDRVVVQCSDSKWVGISKYCDMSAGSRERWFGWSLAMFSYRSQSTFETWYVCNGTWAHLDGVLPIPLICVYMSVQLPLLGNGSVETLPRHRMHTQQQKNCWTIRFLCGPCRIERKLAISHSQRCTIFCQATDIFETLETLYKTTRSCIPHLNIHCCENLKSHWAFWFLFGVLILVRRFCPLNSVWKWTHNNKFALVDHRNVDWWKWGLRDQRE
jgi:hypothetical protein